MDLPLLDPQHPVFPDPATALSYPDGLLAAGGNLDVETLLSAYRQGIFPWYEQGQPILWWSPNPRAVIFPQHIHISKSLAKTLRKGGYRITTDQAFEDVIKACAEPRPEHAERPGENHTWISDEMIAAYVRLFDAGHAHSVEYWLDGQLCGGLYGLAIGKVFCGESMFSRASNASKIAFSHLAKSLEEAGFVLIDCQVENEHLNALGAQLMAREDFIATVKKTASATIDWPAGLISTKV
ncbi:MAG: leucyl/phenylalanyl-tRNA--protein transferase [Gammaproteobacteria bacterium]|nr:leucyl/phenylalanyl-tRNA--protein transferase [Gammaproteobacteria bacterium]MBQ0840606.1 leucyl/phenylalanyl-tRNA--protein transferase [Gammaproteobacteria bacterium]